MRYEVELREVQEVVAELIMPADKRLLIVILVRKSVGKGVVLEVRRVTRMKCVVIV